MHEFSVLIPWRTDSDARERNLDFVLERFEILFEGRVEIILADSGHEVFNRGASRNEAFRAASCDRILIADADTPPMPAIDAAFDLVDTYDTYAYPYDWYYSLNDPATLRILDQGPAATISAPSSRDCMFSMQSWAGAICMTAEMFRQIGGYDENFEGWGYEDTAFHLAAQTLVGAPYRVPGHVVHLWHPPAMEGTWDNFKNEKNKLLCDKYESFLGNREGMRTLIHGDGILLP